MEESSQTLREMSRWPMRLGLLAGFLVVPVSTLLFVCISGIYAGTPGDGVARTAALAGTRRVLHAIESFQAEHHRLPTEAEGLSVLAPHQLAEVPRDPWDHAFIYALSPDRTWADVLSYGADGRPGGVADDSDLSGRFGSLGSRPAGNAERLGELALLAVLLVGWFGSGRWPWAAGMLAGAAALCGTVLLLLLDPSFDVWLATALAALVGLACLTGTVALLRHLPGAPSVAFVAALTAYILLGSLIAG